jgi:uncharacterized protein YndB with AHSA1/START domain
MLRWILYVVVGIVTAIALVVVVGLLLPEGHVASRQATFARPPADVFAAIFDVERYAEWRPDVKRVEVLAREPRMRWKEAGSNGDIILEVQESAPPQRLVARIADPTLPFGGTWTYELAPSGNGTRLTITERGEVYNPMFRFMSKFIFGHTATMDAYLAALARRLG